MTAEIIPITPTNTPAPALLTLEEVAALMQEADAAAAVAAAQVLPAIAARVACWSRVAQREAADAHQHAHDAATQTYTGDTPAIWACQRARDAATAARHAGRWASKYARILERTTTSEGSR